MSGGAKIAGTPVEGRPPVLTVALEVTKDGDGVFYRATVMGRTGTWRRKPQAAVDSAFLLIDTWELAQAIGVMPVINAHSDKVCASCNTPLIAGATVCPGCGAEIPS